MGKRQSRAEPLHPMMSHKTAGGPKSGVLAVVECHFFVTFAELSIFFNYLCLKLCTQ